MRTYLLVAVMTWGAFGTAQGQRKMCQPEQPGTPSAADVALLDGRFEEAAALYGAMPVSGQATAGTVRSLLGEHKLEEALATIVKENAAHAEDALLLDVLGEVRYRRGEVVEAATAYNRSITIDSCAGRVHYDIGLYMNLNGLHASFQRELELAHKLAPRDETIQRAWRRSQQVPLTDEDSLARLRKRAESGTLTEEQKKSTENSIKALQAHQRGDCQMTAPVTSAKVAMYASNTKNSSVDPPTRSGVDVVLNGTRRRFLVDTGASGLLISKDAAKSLGLAPEVETRTNGFGDSGPSATYVAHVDSVKIGAMEFHNCVVRVLETQTLSWVDGLIGPDIFSDFLVTLDFPGSEMRLSALPRRPDASAQTETLSTSGEDAGTAGMTLAQSRKDRYIAPEMKEWQKVFRYRHDLIFPTSINNGPKRLFIMDTGAGQSLISTQTAREVTKFSEDSGAKFSGLSGEVKHVYETDSLSIQFAGVRQMSPGGITAIDTASMSRAAGVEIAGFIGYPMLRQLVIQIDYRDDLVNVVYKPHN